jgi:RimJ/RimL family protein N-acetyltransferase
MSDRKDIGAEQPLLPTLRLLLRPFRPADAELLSCLASARQIADTTISIPHPYALEQAQRFIAGHAEERRRGRAFHYAVVPAAAEDLIGSVELRDIDREHEQAEISFWIGTGNWGEGYATEAVGAVVDDSFTRLGLNRIYAHHMVRNPASGRVLEKIGFVREGLLRQRVRKWGAYEDVVLCALLRRDRVPQR